MKHIAHHRRRHDFHGFKLKHARHRFCVLVRPWIDTATDDETRRARLWAASIRAVQMGLWKYPISKEQRHLPQRMRDQEPLKRVCSRLTCSAILGIWRRIDAPLNPRWDRHSFAWHNWLHDNGWTACGEQSDKFKTKAG